MEVVGNLLGPSTSLAESPVCWQVRGFELHTDKLLQ